jgi:hAT family C-terminal dimerisation region
MMNEYKVKVCNNLYSYYQEGMVKEVDKMSNQVDLTQESVKLPEEKEHMDPVSRVIWERLNKQTKPVNNLQEQEREKKIEEKKNTLRTILDEEVNTYVSYCTENKEMAFHSLINRFPSKEMKEKKILGDETIQMLEYEPGNSHKWFDVLKWWKSMNTKLPYMNKVAPIILGKPTHNAFQERVFSRGSYKDHNLRARTKEKNFEMSVLNSLNHGYTKEIEQQLNMRLDSLQDTTNVEKQMNEYFNAEIRDIMKMSDVPGDTVNTTEKLDEESEEEHSVISEIIINDDDTSDTEESLYEGFVDNSMTIEGESDHESTDEMKERIVETESNNKPTEEEDVQETGVTATV